MKKICVLISLQFVSILCFSQMLTYHQTISLYDAWVKSKGIDYKTVDHQLKALNKKWTLNSIKPIIEDGSKYFVWSAVDSNKDTLYIATYIEEDNETVKYDLRLAFYSKPHFVAFEKEMRAAETRVVSSINQSKYEKEFLSEGSTRSILLREFPLESVDSKKFGYTLDIFSRYIQKK